MTCFLTVLHLTCAALNPLPGTGHPTCDDAPVTVLARVHGSLFEPPVDPTKQETPPWLYEVAPERTETECGEHPIEIVPIETRYPHCVAGRVAKDETTHGEGDDQITIPARPPYHGVCCSQGCSLAGPGEHIPYGTPIGYAEERAKRYAPDE